MDYDVFVSHASEDKPRFVEDLVGALRALGVRCWYDACEIRLGDDVRRKMDEGLSRARYGVVVLSPRFFKYWPEAELSALFAQEAAFDEKRILPVRLDLDHATLTRRSPLLAPRANIGWEGGVAAVAEAIREAVRAEDGPATRSASPVYNLPARRARRLFGRDLDLERVLGMLAPGRNVRLAASIEGLAGVGKTELALNLVDRLSETDRFPGGIFWLDAENPDLANAWGGAIADALAVGPGLLGERAAAAVRIASSGAAVLVVLDNVESWTRESEPRPLPCGPRVALLATTRRRFLAGPSFEHHTLEVLVPEASRAFLSAIAGRDLAREEGTEDLLWHLGGHALALELAGAYLREFPGVSPRKYLDELASGRCVEERVKDVVRYEQTVRQALDTYRGHLDPAAWQALRIAACFAPEDASTALLEACGVDAEAQQPLRRLHLVAGDGDRWRMHRLVREWVLDSAGPEEVAAAERAFVKGCATHARTIDLEEGFRVHRADGPHLDRAVARAASVLGDGDEQVSLLLDRVGMALLSAGELPRAKELLERALASDLKNLGEDHPSVATRRSNLALVLKDLGELPRAEELLERALASDLKSLGEDHPSAARSRSNLAVVLKDLGDLPRAKELLERALASDLKNLGEDHPSVATSRSNLALVLQDLGDLSRAKELLERALASALKNLGEDHPSAATSCSNLAVVIQDLGELPRAKELLERALASALKNFGEDHPSVATSRSNLAVVLQDLGELPRAKELLERALASDLKDLGEDHPSVPTRRSNLAVVLQDLGDLPRAKELLERALASALKNLGEDHPSVATLHSNLAAVLRDLGDLPRAKELLERALASDLRNLGEDHPSVARSRSNLALVLKDLGELPRAKELLERALASALKNLGEGHPSVATRRSNLALVVQDLGDLPRAKELLERALASDLKNLGEDHPSVATRRFHLARIRLAQNDLQGARALFAVTLAAQERSLGADHPSTSYTRVWLAKVMATLGEVDEARAQAFRALRAVADQPAGSRYRALVEEAAEEVLGSSRLPQHPPSER